jgi:pimeloyl-ACP methyl ester carboxylesterase
MSTTTPIDADPQDDGPAPGEREFAASARPLWTELLTVPEWTLSPPGAAVAAFAAPTGGTRPVLVLPGFVTGDVTTLPLRAFLRSLGHRPAGWGLGINIGVPDQTAGELDRLLQELAHRHGSTIDIVGWSAGGVIGRLLAQHRRELVGQVISLGSPIRLQPGQTNIGMIQEIAGRLFVPTPPRIDVDSIPVPSTAIWSPQDGVVPGLLCRQTPGPTAENVQVRGTHCGLATNPAVLYAVADRLAQRPGEWRPFTPRRTLRWWYPSAEEEAELHAPVDAA